jgi:hypothetical protein
MLKQHYDRYKYIRSSPAKYFIALNLYNSERVIPNLALQLINLAEFLGRDRIFISVYENGSEDGTPMQLDVLRNWLDKLGVGNTIINEPGTPVSHAFQLYRSIGPRFIESRNSQNYETRLWFRCMI